MTDSPITPIDGNVRRRAAHDVSTNLVVIAGAGTGKTSLLIERALTALGSGHVEASQLAAITFTEKAAGEMQVRLASGLERLRELASGQSNPDAPEMRAARAAFDHLTGSLRIEVEEIGRRTLTALESLDRMPVKNLHALCIDILRAWPREAGVDPRFRVDPGAHFARLVDDEWPGFLQRELTLDGERRELWSRLLRRIKISDLARAARELSEFRVPTELLSSDDRAGDPLELFEPLIRRLDGELDALLAQRADLAAGGKTLDLLRRCRMGVDLLQARDVTGLRKHAADDPLLADLLAKASPYISKKLAAALRDRVKSVVKETAHLLHDVLLLDEDLSVAVVEALRPFALHVRETALARGIVGFDALLTLARDLLRDHPTVRDTIRRRYRMILVDEFQDTDPVQYEIVLFLAERDGGVATEPYDAELAPGRLFIVGDPKQSIYRFRGADHTEFKRATDRVVAQHGTCLDLVANFRSLPGIIDPLNRLFSDSDTAWEATAYQPDYVSIEPTRPPGDRPGVELWTVDTDGDPNAARRRRAEGEVVATEIARAVEEDGIGWSDVTVVLRAFSNLASYLRPLRRLGIPFVVDGGLDFLTRSEVRHFMALLRALARPDDPVAMLAYLRSPAAGVTDTELARFGATLRTWTWRRRSVDATLFPTVAPALARLNALADEVRDLPVDRLLRHVLMRSSLLTLAAAAFEGAQQVNNLRKMAAVAGRLAREGGLSLPEVLDLVESGQKTELEGDSPMADASEGAVQLLTIHKAKGLENRLVIVPDLARGEGRSDPRDAPRIEPVRLPHGQQVLGVRAGPARNAARALFDRERRLHERAEELRVLYVAMTRARDRLLLIAGLPRGKAPWLAALRAWGYDPKEPPADGARLAGNVLHRVVTAGAREPATAPEPVVGAPEAAAAWREAVARLTTTARPPLRFPSGVRETESLHRESDDAGAGRQSPRAGGAGAAGPRAVGIGVHRLLETWDGVPDDLRAAVDDAAERAAAETGAAIDSVRRDMADLVETFLASELAVRFTTLVQVARELPVCVASADGTTWGGSIDLLYRDEAGRLVVADYKTDREADASRLAHEYGGQLAVYAAAVARAAGTDPAPRTEIWHLRTGTVLEIDTTAPLAGLMGAPKPR